MLFVDIAARADAVPKTTTRIDTLSLTGRSGRQYEFRLYVWDTKFKSVPGVYFVASRSIEPGQKASYSPLFVGAASDLSKAMKSHPRNDCFQMYYANVIGVLREERDDAREQIVADLVASLAPPCNAAEGEW
jgi:hypothetical protein